MALSDHDLLAKDVKRQNFLGFFLHGIEADKYIQTHLYGEIRKAADENPDVTVNESILFDDIMNISAAARMGFGEMTLDVSLLKQKKALDKQVNKVTKMNETQTFLAIIKGYCGAVLLFCPKAFSNGGWAYSTFAMLVSSYFTMICALKLIACGQRYECYSYSLIVQKALGKSGKLFLDFMIAISQYCFIVT